MQIRCSKTSAKLLGFTLVELLATLAIIAIMLTIALPGFQQTINNGRLTSQTNDIVDALLTARSKAVTTHYNAVVEPLSGWTGGFQVYLDKNSNNTFESSIDEIIQKYQQSEGAITISASQQSYTFTSDGRAISAGSFSICSPSEGVTAKQITVTATGRIHTDANVNCY